MAARNVIFAALVGAIVASVEGSKCPPPCPMCPDIIPCSTPTCPVPKCPPLPDIPPCPVPRCPSLPEIPACPTPVLNLSCPNVTCPPQSCPPCPSCPNSPTCPPCSSNATTPAPKLLPNGYTQVYGMGSYKIYPEPGLWALAQFKCLQEGAYLAVPNTQREIDMLLRMMRARGLNLLRVGYVDREGDGTYLSIFGEPMTTEQLSLWEPGEPNGDRNINCAYLSPAYRGMADGPCARSMAFVCKKNA